MRALHCIPGMGGGGAERQLAYLAGALGRRGWQVHVALIADGPNLARLEHSGAVIHRLRATGNYDPRLGWQLARIARQVRPDLVQVWFVQMTLLGGIVSELLHIPWVIAERSSLLAHPPTLKNRLRIALARTANAVISNSAGGDGYWQPHLDGRVRRFVIPNAVPVEEIDAAAPALPASLPVEPCEDIVLFEGRFDSEKNVSVLLTALKEVVRRPRTVAILCGEGPLRAEVQRRIAEDGLATRVFSPGYVAEIWPLMKRASLVVSVARFEGRPNAVIEAMAARRPLLVSDIPAHREILDERSAVFVDGSDPVAVAHAMLRILDDPAAAERRANAARERASRWAVESAAAEYDRIYRLLIADARKGD